MLVRNGSDHEIPEGQLSSVVCRLEFLYTDDRTARVSVGDSSYTTEDASMDDLLALVDEAERMGNPGQVNSAWRAGCSSRLRPARAL